jgi:hypothetical protein
MHRFYTFLLLIFYGHSAAQSSVSPQEANTKLEYLADMPYVQQRPLPSVGAIAAQAAAMGKVTQPPRMYDVMSLVDYSFPHPAPVEPYHWKGLLMQSFAFDMLQNATRIVTANQKDRHLLLNKPFWSDYWASLGQFNMRRWLE